MNLMQAWLIINNLQRYFVSVLLLFVMRAEEQSLISSLVEEIGMKSQDVNATFNELSKSLS